MVLWHRNLTPQSLGCITVNKRTVLEVPSATKTKACVPQHEFADLHLLLSSEFYKHFSLFSAFTFKWTSGNFSI